MQRSANSLNISILNERLVTMYRYTFYHDIFAVEKIVLSSKLPPNNVFRKKHSTPIIRTYFILYSRRRGKTNKNICRWNGERNGFFLCCLDIANRLRIGVCLHGVKMELLIVIICSLSQYLPSLYCYAGIVVKFSCHPFRLVRCTIWQLYTSFV